MKFVWVVTIYQHEENMKWTWVEMKNKTYLNLSNISHFIVYEDHVAAYFLGDQQYPMYITVESFRAISKAQAKGM